MGNDKSKVSNWFNGDPNWTINTIAALAHALGLDINVVATERTTGQVFTASGVQTKVAPAVVPMAANDPYFMITPVKLTIIPANSNPPPETRSIAL